LWRPGAPTGLRPWQPCSPFRSAGLLTWWAQSKLAANQAAVQERRLRTQLEAEQRARREEAESELGLRREEAERELALRREQADEEAATAARIESAENRAAARVIQADLGIAASLLQDIVEKDAQWYGYYTVRLPHWKDEQRRLARVLTVEAWEAVSQSAWELRGLDESM
jgi:hypothetical protein